ncbi:hypothetical protein KFE25_010425 [Diacronema lutheri]|uniref:Uncharacterized protein n=1 Tax=Diacronema lutheri TaxID=2081491 RepID=A0A8J5XGN1_DIALT|nr:hypothetical protein KFE25_010425 [Diacronema lutheri]
MQLARSFAQRTSCPVLRYLAAAQFLGLEGLWQKLCAGKLPERCTKQWYFATFCDQGASAFEKSRFDELDAAADIASHLNGFVKPYDVIALMTVLPVSKQLFPQSALFEHRGVQHLLLLEARHTIRPSPVVNLLRETYHEVVLLTTAQRDARVASLDRKIKVRRFDLQATLGSARASGQQAQQGSQGPHKQARYQMSRVHPCGESAPSPAAPATQAEPHAPHPLSAAAAVTGGASDAVTGGASAAVTGGASAAVTGGASAAVTGGAASSCASISASTGARAPFRLGRTSYVHGLDADASGRSRANARTSGSVLSRDEIVALLIDVLMLAGGRQRTITTATLAIGLSLVVASFVAFAAAALVPDWLTPIEVEVANSAVGWGSFHGAAFVLLSLSPAPAHRARVQYVAVSFGGFLGTAWVLLGDATFLRTLFAQGYAPDGAVFNPPKARLYVAVRIAQELVYTVTWCVGSFALVALAIASRCTRRVSTKLLLTALWAHFGGASLFMVLHRAVTVPLDAFFGSALYKDARLGRSLLVLNLVASVFLLAQAIATQFVGIRHRLVRLIARVCCSASGAEASLAPLLGFGSRYGERAPDDVCAEAEHAFRPCTLAPVLLAQIETSGLEARLNYTLPQRATFGRFERLVRFPRAMAASRLSDTRSASPLRAPLR